MVLRMDDHDPDPERLHDPVEDDPKIRPIIRAATKQAMDELKDHPFYEQFGFCHFLWDKKKQILKEKYGIDWRSPSDMNPHIIYD